MTKAHGSSASSPEIRIDPEFKDYLGPLDNTTLKQLEESIAAEGCRDQLVVWRQPDDTLILLDGHNRYDICGRLGISYTIVECPPSVTDRESALVWIVNNQRARRNMTLIQLRYCCGKTYLAERKKHGGSRKSGEAKSSGQNDHLKEDLKTAGRLAAEYGVKEKTVRRYSKFAEDVDKFATEHGRDSKAEILAGRLELPKVNPVAKAVRVDSVPVDAASVDSVQVDADSIDSVLIDAASGDSAPVNAAPVDAGPVDSALGDSVPVDAGLVDLSPVDAASGNSAPAMPMFAKHLLTMQEVKIRLQLTRSEITRNPQPIEKRIEYKRHITQLLDELQEFNADLDRSELWLDNEDSGFDDPDIDYTGLINTHIEWEAEIMRGK